MNGRARDAVLVAGQMALIAAAGAAGFAGPRWPRIGAGRRRAAGLALLAGGAAFGVAGSRALGPALTPRPTPRAGAGVCDRGPYRVVRHPVYAGVLASAAGWALLRRPAALAPLAGLAGLLHAKALLEERLMEAADPGYAAYRERVRFRIVPFVA
ncbi:MAG: methyltransferase [Thermoleophilia bacterium]